MKKSLQPPSLLGRIGGAVGFILLGALGCYLVMKSTASPLPEPADTATAPLVPLVSVVAQNLTEHINTFGTVVAPAHDELAVAFEQAGEIQRLNIRVGMRIQRGQIVAEIRRAAFERALRAARASTQAAGLRLAAGIKCEAEAQNRWKWAQVRLENLLARYRDVKAARLMAEAERRQASRLVASDQRALEDSTRLVSGGESASIELVKWKAALAADELTEQQAALKLKMISSERQAAVASARNELANALTSLETAQLQASGLAAEYATAAAIALKKQQELDHTALHAPLNGIVTMVAVHVGEKVARGSSVLRVATTNRRLLALRLDAGIAAHLHVHDVVGIAGAPHVAATLGDIEAIVPQSRSDDHQSTILIKGIADKTPLGTRMSVLLDVVWPHQIVVPVSATLKDPKSGKTSVLIYSADHQYGQSGFSLREVSLGSRNVQHIAINSGLNIGEQIALHASYRLLDSANPP